MPKPWDETCKRLIQVYPQGFVALLMGSDATFLNEEPRELVGNTTEVDGLLRVLINGQEVFLHIEFQTYYDSLMDQRLLRYNVSARCDYGVPVNSFVFHLLSDTTLPTSPLRWTIPGAKGDEEVLTFHFTVIEVGQLTPEEILASGHDILLPFLPLTQDGARRDVVLQMDAVLQKDNKLELLGLGYTFAGLAMRESPDDVAWIKRRIKMLNMEDNPIITWLEEIGFEKGLEKGIEKERQEQMRYLQRNLAIFVSARFPKLQTQAKSHIETLTDPEALQDLLLQLALADSPDEARRLLTSNNKTKSRKRSLDQKKDQDA